MSTLSFSVKAPKRAYTRDVYVNRKLLILLSQICLIVVTYYLSFLLRFDFAPGSSELQLIIRTLPLVLVVKLFVFYLFGLVRGWWRYVGMSDLADISKAAALS
jgi:FlaA1/EpsC-like NDP-sugar epimerase